jgi:hypothetical protein
MVQPARPLGCGVAREAPCYPRAAAG